MIEKIKQTINKYNMLKNNEKVVLALSGGPDSTALAVSLAQIAPQMNLQLIGAHFNHGLRGRDSKEDERYVRILTKKLGMSFFSVKMDRSASAKGFSPEDFYRRQRYAFLNEVAESHHAHKIALGHNLQDQAETVLLHLLRGSGLEGLKGILPQRDGKFIRPLIEISREEIKIFLSAAGIDYRHDSSNESKYHLRNKIRLELLPYLKREFNPRIVETLAQTAEILSEENRFIKENVFHALQTNCIKKQKNKIILNIEYINTLSMTIQRRILKEILEDFSQQRNGITFLHINIVSQMLQNFTTGKRICLPFGIEARREYDNLILERIRGRSNRSEYCYQVVIPGSIFLKERNVTVSFRIVKKNKVKFAAQNKDYFDLDKIQMPLMLRNRRAGDWFVPLGMTGRQKLRSFFIDHKIPQQKRNEIILLADQQAVIWIEKMHLNDRVKITRETKNILELEIV